MNGMHQSPRTWQYRRWRIVSFLGSLRSARVVFLDWNVVIWIFLVLLPESEDSTDIDTTITSNLGFANAATTAHSNDHATDCWRNSHGTPGGCLGEDVADACGGDVELLAVDPPHKQQ